MGMIVAEIKSRSKIHKEVSVCSEGIPCHCTGHWDARPNHAACSVALSPRSLNPLRDASPVGFFLGVGDTVSHEQETQPQASQRLSFQSREECK